MNFVSMPYVCLPYVCLLRGLPRLLLSCRASDGAGGLCGGTKGWQGLNSEVRSNASPDLIEY